MILLIDTGNTNITIGCYYDNQTRNVLRLKTIVGGRDVEEYSYILNGFIRSQNIKEPEGAALCSVVPEVTPVLTETLKKSFRIEPVIVHHTIKTGLKFRIKNADELGADRISNAVAAHNRYKGSVIVVDFGTATTFCVVSEKGEYRGGAIMPGLALSAQTLGEKAAQLPAIELKAPDSILGKNTEENIRAGVMVGHAGAVERIINDIKAETDIQYSVLATGGFASLITPYLTKFDYLNPNLTLEGLKLIYELNS